MEIKMHHSFTLNGSTFKTKDELLLFSKEYLSDLFFFLNELFNDSDFIKLQTSGSTGLPKSIDVKKDFLINSALITGKYFELHEGTTALLCMNPTYIAGKMMLVRAIVLGWTLDVVEAKLNPLKGRSKRYDFSAMIPLQVFNSINELNKIDKLIVGGGAISFELEKMLQKVSTKVYATYGMTETVSHIAVRLVNSDAYYNLLPDVSVLLDERDCLVIDAPKITNCRVITNDIVQLISPVNFRWLGRYDNIINSGGIKLIPEQIELKLSDIISERFFVVGIFDKVLGQKLVLIVEGKNGGNDILENAKKTKSLSKYEIPKEIYFIDSFIETETKKIQRKKVMELVLSS